MPAPTVITISQLQRLIGLPEAPRLIDVRTDAEFAADNRMLPGAVRRDGGTAAGWAGALAGRSVVVVCQHGGSRGAGVAAWLRHEGIRAETLEGGFAGWREAGGLLTNPHHMPPRDASGRTVWVTRGRPKIVRIACPWLIRRFVDPTAMFLFVPPSDVPGVVAQFGATPFDMADGFWSDRGARCTFDVMLDEFSLSSDALDRLAQIVRGADTGCLELAPQAAGLLAASLGLSRMYRDDLAQLDAGFTLYDAFYRWARDATDEKHGDV